MRFTKILAFFLATLMLVGLVSAYGVAAEEKSAYGDVGAKKWFYEAVTYVSENGLMNGTSATKFEPMASMTRAMFVTVLGRLTGVDEKNFTPDSFSDTKNNTWYSPYVSWAQENSIVGGYEDGTFKPMKNVTREEMSAIIIRYIEFLGLKMITDADAPRKFTDAGKIAKWARDYVDTMRRYGIVAGDANNNFTPKETLNRAQAATIIMRLDQVIDEITYEEYMLPDYSENGGEYLVMGAWDLYYAALGTNTNGFEVKVGDKYAEYTYNVRSEGVTENSMNLTERGIDITVYPFVRVGYVQDTGAFDLSFACNGWGGFSHIDWLKSGSADGVDYAIVDTTGLGNEYTYYKSMQFESTGATESSIVYAAFFKTQAEAEAFDFSAVSEKLKSYDGPEITYDKITKAEADKYIADADKRIDEIINTENVLTPEYVESLGGTCYYISSKNGDDSNDGLTPETAWKTPMAMFKLLPIGEYVVKTVKEGDGIFFERGSVFDGSGEVYHYKGSGDSILCGVVGCYYGAYGEGPKPIFSNSVDYYGQTPWTKTEYENIWRLDYDFERPAKSTSYFYHDVGNIVLTDNNGNVGHGIKITMNCAEGTDQEGRLGIGNSTKGLGFVPDGFGNVYNVEARSSNTVADVLKNNLEFFHAFDDSFTSDLYMYYDGDLNADFKSIIVAKKGHISNMGGVAMVDNLSFEYGGSHGIMCGGEGQLDMTVQNCTFYWIGGSLQGGSTRFGNALESWDACDGLYVRNNYVYQAYDAGLTAQGSGDMRNFYLKDNVISHAVMPVELFNYDQTGIGSANYYMTGNYILYTGYGFGTTRSDRTIRSPFFAWASHSGWQNVNFTDNICVYSACHGAFAGDRFAFGDTNDGIHLGNNVYVTNKIALNLGQFREGLLGSNPGKHFNIPMSERGVGYIQSMGIEHGTKFYFFDDYVVEEEKLGAYVDLGREAY